MKTSKQLITVKLTINELQAVHEFISRTTMGQLVLSGLPDEHTKPLHTSLAAFDKSLITVALQENLGV